ncbi:class I SAM-dependent methyltransferase [Corynebacterium mendelii]|uniref:Class I SAM-dependent methyltransferase n=1 Tax=Corynebacterium mendelii TaxID=2765362 RepID=A0A939ITV6_9CORY|nr:class I SAM-dependent methyltransferase [Corynebacterium mendelii]MBN9644254.1 class I SAM-dependent methyltransferase [Corynebacterium mendelii]
MTADIDQATLMRVYGTGIGSTAAEGLWNRAFAADRYGIDGWSDPAAVEAWEKLADIGRRCGHDPRRLVSGSKSLGVGIITRSRVTDGFLAEFRRLYPTSHQIVIVGIGLDTRPQRLADEAATWIGVDFDGSVTLREKLFDDDPVVCVAQSVTEPGWCDMLDPDVPTCLIAEGLLRYFTTGEVQSFMKAVTGHMQAPVWLVADTHHTSPAALPLKKIVADTTGRPVSFAVDSAAGLAGLCPGWRPVAEMPLTGAHTWAGRAGGLFTLATGEYTYSCKVIAWDGPDHRPAAQ